jgi:murein DD-endopeptidase MepM/ murein hydrolase activator NlpD
MQNSSISSVLPSTNIQNSSQSTVKPQTETSSTTLEFRDLLTVMLLRSFSSQSSTDSGFGGLEFQQLLAPLMFGLLEKLLSQNIETKEITQEKVAFAEPVNSPAGKPVKGVLTQGSHPGHVALDFGVPVGTVVKSTIDGKVVFAGWNNEGYGNLVIIENGPYRVYYAHLSDYTVKFGEVVKAGQKIALSGNTGNSTGPHLHYEVRKNGNQIDPTGFTL